VPKSSYGVNAWRRTASRWPVRDLSAVAARAARSHGRKITVTPPLFPGYLFVWVVRGWWDARWSPGVVRLIMDGLLPARVPDAVISEIRSRERRGLIELPKLRLEPGMRVKVLQGPLQDQIGLLAALRPHERVLVLLQLLGGQQRVELARSSIEAMNP
jgi:transcriptional antiterminator RfaH